VRTPRPGLPGDLGSPGLHTRPDEGGIRGRGLLDRLGTRQQIQEVPGRGRAGLGPIVPRIVAIPYDRRPSRGSGAWVTRVNRAGAFFTTSRTGARPGCSKPRRRAAARDRSMMRRRGATYGPRSLMRTTTRRPVRRCVTATAVPSGKVRCAAVREYMEKCSPVAVGLPWWNDPYHEAHPTCPLRDRRASAGAVVAASQTPRSAIQRMVARMMVTRTSTLHGGKGHVISRWDNLMTWGCLLEYITWYSVHDGSDAMVARLERSHHDVRIFHEE
jgi:hypothetical protein